MKKIFVFAVITASMSLISCGATKQAANNDYQYQQWLAQQNQQQSQTASENRPVAMGTADKVREWQKEGKVLVGANSTFTMYDLLERHNNLILSDMERYVSVYGNGIAPDGEVSTARLFAINDASVNYATAAGSIVSGGMTRQFSNFGEIGTKLMGAYTQKVSEYITPYLKESLAVKRVVDKGLEIEVYYILDEQKAKDVRKNAMDAALKETATEQIFGNAVNEWVKEFVSPAQ